jgi:hypothetical protein
MVVTLEMQIPIFQTELLSTSKTSGKEIENRSQG